MSKRIVFPKAATGTIVRDEHGNVFTFPKAPTHSNNQISATDMAINIHKFPKAPTHSNVKGIKMLKEMKDEKERNTRLDEALRLARKADEKRQKKELSSAEREKLFDEMLGDVGDISSILQKIKKKGGKTRRRKTKRSNKTRRRY